MHFASDAGHPKDANAQSVSHRALLLHYPFCHYAAWRHKFNILDSSQLADWGFYRDSRFAIFEATKRIQKAVKAKASADTATASDGKGNVEGKPKGEAAVEAVEAEVESELVTFFRKHVMLQHEESAAPGATDSSAASGSAASSSCSSSRADGLSAAQAAQAAQGAGAGAGAAVAVAGAEEAAARRGEEPSDLAIALILPSQAQTQCWRNGIYCRVHPPPPHAAVARAPSSLSSSSSSSVQPPPPPKAVNGNASASASASASGASGSSASVDAAAAAGGGGGGGSAASSAAAASGSEPEEDDVCYQRRASSAFAQQPAKQGGKGGTGGEGGSASSSSSGGSSRSSGSAAPAAVESYLYRIAAKGAWYLGSKPGSDVAAAVCYDSAPTPDAIRAQSTWRIYDGKAWVAVHASSSAAGKGTPGSVRIERCFQMTDDGRALSLIDVRARRRDLWTARIIAAASNADADAGSSGGGVGGYGSGFDADGVPDSVRRLRLSNKRAAPDGEVRHGSVVVVSPWHGTDVGTVMAAPCWYILSYILSSPRHAVLVISSL